MSLGNAFHPDRVYTGQQIIDFLKEAEDQYADKINMIEAQRQVAMNDAVALRVEYGKVLRSAARLEQQLQQAEEARGQAVQECERLKRQAEAQLEGHAEDETGELFPAGDGVAGE